MCPLIERPDMVAGRKIKQQDLSVRTYNKLAQAGFAYKDEEGEWTIDALRLAYIENVFILQAMTDPRWGGAIKGKGLGENGINEIIQLLNNWAKE